MRNIQLSTLWVHWWGVIFMIQIAAAYWVNWLWFQLVMQNCQPVAQVRQLPGHSIQSWSPTTQPCIVHCSYYTYTCMCTCTPAHLHTLHVRVHVHLHTCTPAHTACTCTLLHMHTIYTPTLYTLTFTLCASHLHTTHIHTLTLVHHISCTCTCTLHCVPHTSTPSHCTPCLHVCKLYTHT